MLHKLIINQFKTNQIYSEISFTFEDKYKNTQIIQNKTKLLFMCKYSLYVRFSFMLLVFLFIHN